MTEPFFFPYTKYEHPKALNHNFRLLEIHLNRLKNLNTPRGATVVVASQDSSQLAKDSADYVANGTADEDTIIEALKALESISDTSDDRGTLLLLEGVYNIDSSIDLDTTGVPQNNYAIVGLRGTILVPTANSVNVFEFSSGTAIDFVNLTFWNRDGTTSNRGLSLGAANEIRVVDCRFLSLNQGIFTTGAGEGVMVYGCAFNSCTTGISNQANIGHHGLNVGLCRFKSNTTGAEQRGTNSRGLVITNSSFFDNMTAVDQVNTQVVQVTACFFDGNTANFSKGSSSTFVDSHNIADDAHHQGLHTGIEGDLDHGSIGGLGDDDHTQYLLDKASGGVASEVPEHDHSAAAEGSKTAMEELADAEGDIWIASAADTASRLAIGTADQVLRVNSGATAPEWTDGWTDWTPTLTNITLGNGTQVARFGRFGNLIACYYFLTFGSTTSIDGIGATISTPVTASSDYTTVENYIGGARFFDADAANAFGHVRLETTTTFRPVVHKADSTYIREAGITATVPFTWTTSDILHFSAVYEAA